MLIAELGKRKDENKKKTAAFILSSSESLPVVFVTPEQCLKVFPSFYTPTYIFNAPHAFLLLLPQRRPPKDIPQPTAHFRLFCTCIPGVAISVFWHNVSHSSKVTRRRLLSCSVLNFENFLAYASHLLRISLRRVRQGQAAVEGGYLLSLGRGYGPSSPPSSPAGEARVGRGQQQAVWAGISSTTCSSSSLAENRVLSESRKRGFVCVF